MSSKVFDSKVFESKCGECSVPAPPLPSYKWKQTNKAVAKLLRRKHGDSLELRWDKGKGRSLHSRWDYKPGEAILVEQPLAIVGLPAGPNKLWDELIKVKDKWKLPLEPIWYWCAVNTAYVKEPETAVAPVIETMAPMEVQVEAVRCESDEDSSPRHEETVGLLEDQEIVKKAKEDPLSFLEPVSPEADAKMELLYRHDVQEPSFEILVIVQGLSLGKYLDPKKVEERLQTFVHNCYESYTSEGMPALGLWFTPSFISHSCVPNAIWVVDEHHHYFLSARRQIPEGEEICISYLADEILDYPVAQRRELLAKSKQFICQCSRCEGKDNVAPFTCFICGQLLMFYKTGDELKSKSFCSRLMGRLMVIVVACVHIFFCAITGGEV